MKFSLDFSVGRDQAAHVVVCPNCNAVLSRHKGEADPRNCTRCKLTNRCTSCSSDAFYAAEPVREDEKAIAEKARNTKLKSDKVIKK